MKFKKNFLCSNQLKDELNKTILFSISQNNMARSYNKTKIINYLT